jgi:hypothetical protein
MLWMILPTLKGSRRFDTYNPAAQLLQSCAESIAALWNQGCKSATLG